MKSFEEQINGVIDEVLGKILRENFNPDNPLEGLLYKTEYCKGFREGFEAGVKWLIAKEIFKTD